MRGQCLNWVKSADFCRARPGPLYLR